VPVTVVYTEINLGWKGLMDGWRRREIGISGGGSLRRPRSTQGCSAEKKKKK